jgi:hypothetical protein
MDSFPTYCPVRRTAACVQLRVQGTISTKKKKQRKLKRVQAAVKRAERREEGGRQENFAALQLLHDPQVRHTPRATAGVVCS